MYEHGKPTATLGEGGFFGQASLSRHVSATSALVAQRPTSCTVVRVRVRVGGRVGGRGRVRVGARVRVRVGVGVRVRVS